MNKNTVLEEYAFQQIHSQKSRPRDDRGAQNKKWMNNTTIKGERNQTYSKG